MLACALIGCDGVDDLNDSEYSELEQEISEKDDKIANLELRISENDSRIDELLSGEQNKNRKISELEQRIAHLEAGFDRSSPESVADLWGKAMATRNGALVYALYSDTSEEKPFHDRSDVFIWPDGWHMGVSNPHFIEYKVLPKTTNIDGAVLIEVSLTADISGGDPLDDTATLTLTEFNDYGWYIMSVAW